MSKTVVWLIAFVALISITGFLVPDSSIYNFFMPSDVISEICLLLAAIMAVMLLLIRVSITRMTKDFLASLLGIIGCSLMVISFLGLVSPTYFGTFADFVSQVNLMVFLVLGISYSMAGLTIPHRNILSQMLELRNIVALTNAKQMDAELKLWMVSHTPTLFYS